MVNGQWSMVNGQWSMVNGQYPLFTTHHSPFTTHISPFTSPKWPKEKQSLLRKAGHWAVRSKDPENKLFILWILCHRRIPMKIT